MKTLFSELRAAVMATAALVIICCIAYPLVVFCLSQAFFSVKANGSLIMDSSHGIRGSALIGQPFTGEKYFHPRPSVAGNGYDASSSGGSNLGPTSQKLNDAIQDRVATYRKENGLGNQTEIPADAVTASGSGLDPHISIRNAELQTLRVAKARNLSTDKVKALIRANTDSTDLGILGEPGVNVLRLNVALDRETQKY